MPIITVERYVDNNKGCEVMAEDTASFNGRFFRWHLNHGTQVGLEAVMPNFSQRFMEGLLVADDPVIVSSKTGGRDSPAIQRMSLIEWGMMKDAGVKELGKLLSSLSSSGRKIHVYPATNPNHYDSSGRVILFSASAPDNVKYERVRDLHVYLRGF